MGHGYNASGTPAATIVYNNVAIKTQGAMTNR